MILEMIRHHSIVDVFFAAKTLRNSKPNMVETMVSKSYYAGKEKCVLQEDMEMK